MISWRHPHTSWGFSWGFPFSCILLLLLLSGVQAQDSPGTATSPSNSSRDLAQVGPLRFFLHSAQLQLPSPVLLAPLTQPLATLSLTDFTQFNLSGQLLAVDPSNSVAVDDSDIAFISCDPSSYPGVLSAGVTIANVIQSQPAPAGIILYSAQSDHCNYTVDDPDLTYSTVFTVQGVNATRSILEQLSSHSNHSFSSIGPDMASIGNGSVTGGGTGSDSSGSSVGSGSLAGASPTTAVAMIILYSITGIITALFLGIIITGAIRAHRHPERYGPRNVVGRPRQSRARGLARAMLETIPIVKFGDPDDRVDAAAKGDVEMASGHEVDGTDRPEKQRASAPNANDTGRSPESPSNGNNSEDAGKEATPAAKETAGYEHSNETGNYVCPICTDDFVKGQDVRVLPCNHQFHPECIDPWLVNVSGTCPLCRIDLNPAEEQDGDSDDAERHPHASGLPLEVPQTEASTGAIQHRGLSSYFPDMRRMRHAPVEERIAALRRLRQSSEQVRDADAAELTAEERQNRRRSLTARLRERFRIRTRQHDDQPPPAPPSQPPSTL